MFVQAINTLPNDSQYLAAANLFIMQEIYKNNSKKHSFISTLLGLLFGGIGLMYVSISQGLLCLAIQFISLQIAVRLDGGLFIIFIWLLGGAWGYLATRFPEKFKVFKWFDIKFGVTFIEKISKGLLCVFLIILTTAFVISVIETPEQRAAYEKRKSDKMTLDQWKSDQAASEAAGKRVWEKMQAQEEERRRIQQDELWREQVRRR